jgi:aminoglycoside phosphotransferase (APT) family kinase protein
VFPERQQWLDGYAAVTNTVIDDDAVRWWEVATTFKWAVICLTQWNRHRQGTTHSVELAVIGRRVAENEFDLLKLIP